MADIYKIIAIALLLGLGSSLVDAVARDGDVIDNWMELSAIAEWKTNTANNVVTSMTEDEKLLAQQSETQIEDTKGTSFVMLVGMVIVLVKMAVMSIVLTAKIATYDTGADNILRTIAIMCSLFYLLLQGFIGLKLYSWIASKDTR